MKFLTFDDYNNNINLENIESIHMVPEVRSEEIFYLTCITNSGQDYFLATGDSAKIQQLKNSLMSELLKDSPSKVINIDKLEKEKNNRHD